MTMRLFYSPPTCSLAAMAALGMAGEPFEPVLVDIAGDRDELRRVNPFGKVPALEHDGLRISDTVAIILWLNATFPDAGLLPHDKDAVAIVLSRMAWLGSELHIRRRRYSRPIAFAIDPAAQVTIRDQAWQPYQDGLAEVNEWYNRPDPQICPGLDAYALLFLHWAVIDGIDTKSLDGLHRLVARLRANAGVARALELHASPLVGS